MLTSLYFIFYLTTILAIGLTIAVFVTTAKSQTIIYPGKPLGYIEITRMKNAIKSVENWNGYSIGSKGERGAMQMIPSIWAIYHCDETTYVKDLILACKSMRRNPTPYLVALIHNAGLPAVLSSHVPAMKKSFASRVQNVYDELSK